MAQEDTLETDGSCVTYNNTEFYPQQTLDAVKVCNSAPRTPVPDTHQQVALVRTPSNRTSTSSISDSNETALELDSDEEDLRRPDFPSEIIKQMNGSVPSPTIEVNGMPPCAIPTIQSIAIKNSTDVTFGNKTHYHGPVTIKQFLVDKGKLSLVDEGLINGAFDKSRDSLYPGK